jgi:hypothetical protein
LRPWISATWLQWGCFKRGIRFWSLIDISIVWYWTGDIYYSLILIYLLIDFRLWYIKLGICIKLWYIIVWYIHIESYWYILGIKLDT